jgi:hypothetical protein
LVEDLRPDTWELVVGFLPVVREEMVRASQPRERPALLVRERLKEVGPDDSPIVNDLRAVLLEVASEPPRLRQDNALFQKELDRFQSALGPLPAWLLEAMKWSDDRRLVQATAWARALQLVEQGSEGNAIRLHLTSKGRQWLSKGFDEQYAALYDVLRPIQSQNHISYYYPHLFYAASASFHSMGTGDAQFLGEQVTVMKAEKPKGSLSPQYWDAKAEDLRELRKHLDQAITALKPGVFYRLDHVEPHLAYAEHNPLNLGLTIGQVAVFWLNRLVPPLEEQREEAGRLLIDAFVRRRLVPLGCVQAAIDDEGQLCIARNLRFDAYFGREVARADMSSTAGVAARVVVQPDFSVIVIGPNPAPAAELAPFCERTTRAVGQGAMVLKITRESVVKAVSHGLKPAEIAARLQRHASIEVPANVLREVQDWANWVRHVTASTLTVLRCPDRNTADRVVSALKNQAERVNETLVAIDTKSLTTTERNKLRSQGIIVGRDAGP